ncbi:hypothetical protein GCM10023196_021350 [Actinoallomurus vinaceus]|uniref:Uncharacterized protein n=1 Tax=Actinoallomurus vinaceus TaxID=1080074 RepID=A0ABP8U7N2_9ACTN
MPQALVNMVDEPEKVAAVHGGIREAGFLSVAIRVIARAAHLAHRAFAAGVAEGREAHLTCCDRRVVQRQVEWMGEDVQTRLRGAFEAGLQRITCWMVPSVSTVIRTLGLSPTESTRL